MSVETKDLNQRSAEKTDIVARRDERVNVREELLGAITENRIPLMCLLASVALLYYALSLVNGWVFVAALLLFIYAVFAASGLLGSMIRSLFGTGLTILGYGCVRGILKRLHDMATGKILFALEYLTETGEIIKEDPLLRLGRHIEGSFGDLNWGLLMYSIGLLIAVYSLYEAGTRLKEILLRKKVQ